MITIHLKETDTKFKGKVNEALAGLLNKLVFRKKGAIVRDIRKVMVDWVNEQPEMKDLRSGFSGNYLGSQFGLFPGGGIDAADAITQAFINSFTIDVSRIRKKDLAGGVQLNFMPVTFNELLALPEGHTVYEGGDLHWLRWLLLEGYKVLVVGFHFRFQPGRGRSQLGYMRKGGFWRVPPEYAGTADDNFVTRALRNPANERQIQSIFERHIR